MAVTYFGFGVDSSGNVSGTPSPDTGYGAATFTYWVDPAYGADNFAAYFACPGVGSFDVVDICAYLNETSNGSTFQLGVYDLITPFALMAYGTSAVAMVAGPSWQGYQSAGVITQVTPLTGGHCYGVLQTHPAGGTYTVNFGDLGINLTSSTKLNTTSYSGAMPANLPTPTGNQYTLMVRIGVQPAGATATAGRLIGRTPINSMLGRLVY